ncbi:hypothetical protein EMIT0324P_30739 [Pseudomonas chlororaphis]
MPAKASKVVVQVQRIAWVADASRRYAASQARQRLQGKAMPAAACRPGLTVSQLRVYRIRLLRAPARRGYVR